MTFPFGVTLTVQRPVGAVDRYGQRTFADHHTIGPCAVDYSASTENTANREAVTVDAVVFAPPGSDVLATDRIKLSGGDVFRVVGLPAPWLNPFTGWAPGVTIRLARTTG